MKLFCPNSFSSENLVIIQTKHLLSSYYTYDIQQGCNITTRVPSLHTQLVIFSLHYSTSHSYVDDALEVEWSANCIRCPSDSPSLPKFYCSGLDLITTSQLPLGKGINDLIDSDTYALTYCTVNDANVIVNLLHHDTLLSENAFCLVPVQP